MSVEEKLKKELKLIKGNSDLVTCDEVIEWAKVNPKSEWHRQLEWNDKIAGHQFRLWQVRRLMAIHITYEDSTRQLVSLSVDRSRPGGGYRDINDVLSEKTLHDVLMADALRELERVQQKYSELKKLRPVWRAASKVRRSFKRADKSKRAAA